MEMGERVSIEGDHGHWNPGIPSTSVPSISSQQSQGQENWPPVDCIMNGLATDQQQNQNHMGIFGVGGSPLLLAHQFRHRLSHPGIGVHFPAQIIDHAHNINLQHSMVDNSEASSSVLAEQEAQQDSRAQPMSLISGHHVLDDCSEECSDEEDDEDVTDDEMEHPSYVHPHAPQMSIHSHLTCGDEDSLPACRQLGSINSEMMGDPSTQHELPAIISSSEGHPLNSNPISAIPMITGGNHGENPLLIEDSQGKESQENLQGGIGGMNFGANGGHSVHGKMYVEDRVVFHLKQWSDSGFSSFVSCRQDKNLGGCAICHSRGVEGNLKDGHRHTVRGVLLSYNDCIIVELYPEQFIAEGQNSTDHLDPKQSLHMESKSSEHALPSYLNHPEQNIEEHPHDMANLIVNNASAHESAATIGGGLKQPEQNSWWEDEFDPNSRQEPHSNRIITSNANLLHEESLENVHLQPHPSQSSHAGNINAQHFHDELEVEEKTVPIANKAIIMQNSVENVQEYEMEETQDYLQEENNDSMDSVNQEDVEGVDNEKYENSVHQNGGKSLESLQTEYADAEENSLASKHKQSKGSKPSNSKKSKSSSSKKENKYPCPSCTKSFPLKNILKQHLDEKHESGNPLKCSKCKLQFTDAKRFQRHSCTLSVEAIKKKLNKNIITTTAVPEEEQEIRGKKTKVQEFSKELNSDEISRKQATVSVLTLKKSIQKKQNLEIFAENSKISEDAQKTSKKVPGDKRKLEEEEIKKMKKKRDKMTWKSKSDEENRGQADELEEDEEDYETQTRYLVGSTAAKTLSSADHHHQNSSSGQQVRGKRKDFKCTQCDKQFTNERRLLNHLGTHGVEKLSQCEKCGKSFARKDKLLRHMYVHSEEKLFSCEICQKRFSRRDKLADHMKSHQTEEVHDCPHCEKQFLRPDILKQHLKLHETEDKHQCKECLRFVTGKERLTQHMKRHEEAKALGETLLCPLCTKYFIQRQSLKAHIKKFHPDALKQIKLKQMEGGDQGNEKTFYLKEDKSDDDNDDPSSNDGEPPNQKLSTVCLVLDDVMSSSKPSSSDKLKPFKCKLCPQSFAKKQSLQKHCEIKHSTSKTKRSLEQTQKSTPPPPIEPEPLPSPPEIKQQDHHPPVKGKIGKKTKQKSSRSPSISTTSPPDSATTTTNESLRLIPHYQPSRTLSQLSVPLPSCSSLTHNLTFEPINQPGVQGNSSMHSLNVYSHHLALAAASIASGRTFQGNVATTSGNLIAQDHLIMPHHQLHQINPYASATGQNSILCPTSSPYILNYPYDNSHQ